MKGQIDGLVKIAEVEKIDFSLDKFVKYANHLAIEFTRNPYIEEGDKRGEKYVVQLIEECFYRKILTPDERNDFYSGEINIEEIVFIILEILISQGYFIVEDYWISDSSNGISFVYAWNTYIRLGKALGKGTIEIPSMYIDTGNSILQIPYQRDEELEQKTLGVINILSQGNYTPEHTEYTPENITVFNNYLKLLHKKGIIDKDRLKNAIGSDDIESIITSIIHDEIFKVEKLPDSIIREAFYEYYDACNKRIQEATKKKIDFILNEEDEDPIEDIFLSHLSTGLSILQYLADLGGELYEYDVEELIALAYEHQIVTIEVKDELMNLLNTNAGNKAQIVYQIFLYSYHSGYIDKVEMSEEERNLLKSHYSNIYYALQMIYLD